MSNSKGSRPGSGVAKDIGLLPIDLPFEPDSDMTGDVACIRTDTMPASAARNGKTPTAPR